ncbi:hypothetical protein F0U44_09235 [Nocardioides humilatus]|uniref:DUF6801 domain-containing protein n=1 Tax=Nocardioides humilatus TaxID=2607660 RepID=A0A5B1LFW2_9ACTN|nr:DUF6801 domain-containing protein [Nocardioides humilatus]KAA1418670.1 hypothetical protein F0U44_09235 [Nocardioides humilatus]
MSRRAAALATATVLLSSVASVIVGAAPAHATEVDKTIGYHCSSSFGDGDSDVRILATIPDRVAQGVSVPARTVTFKIKVPGRMVRMMRLYGVDSVSGSGKASYFVGSLKRPIRDVHIPNTDVPNSGGMTIKGTGRAASFMINQAGTYDVKVSKKLLATVAAHVDGSSYSADLTCNVRRGESRKLASLEVIR